MRVSLPSLLTCCALLLFTNLSLTAQQIHACTEMPVTAVPGGPVSVPEILGRINGRPPLVQRAVAVNPTAGGYSNYWTNGSTLRISFMGGSATLRQKVLNYAREWTRHANLNFQEVSSGPADIRISFVLNGSAWSLIGRQSLAAREGQPTMNLGWLTDRTPDAEIRRVALHEFGHALGLLHEHQNPTGGIPWDEPAVYEFYQRTQGWDQRTTYRNVIERRGSNETQYSNYDPVSIMHYPVDPKLTAGRYEVGMNDKLSSTDISFIRRMYPGRGGAEVTPVAEKPAQPARRPTAVNEPVKPVSRPTAIAASTLRIHNQLGEQQVAEVVHVYLNDRKHTIYLRADGGRRQSLEFRLRPGTYRYRLETVSVYRLQNRRHRTIYGDGSGEIDVREDKDLVLYGKYDGERGRMKVYLGQAKK